MPAGRPRMDRQLAHCREEELSCRECVSNSAASLARISTGLSNSTVRQLFVLMYPETHCQSMASSFIQLVNQPTAVCRRKPILAEPLYQVAVA